MAFERYTRTRARGLLPKASIWSRGQIGFNQSAVLRFEINKFDYIVLFYDLDTKRIGIKLTNEQEEGAIKIINKLASGGALISAKSFLINYDLFSQETRNYDLYLDTDSGLLVIDTNKYKKRATRANFDEK